MYIEIGAARLLPLQLIMVLPVIEEYDWRMRVQHVCDMLCASFLLLIRDVLRLPLSFARRHIGRFGGRELEVNGVWEANVVSMLGELSLRSAEISNE